MNEVSETVAVLPPADRLKESGIAFSLAALLPVLVSLVLSVLVAAMGEGAQNAVWYRYLAYFLPQLCFALSAAVYFRRARHPFPEMYRGAKWHYYLIALFMQLGLLFSLGELNTLFIGWLEKLGYTSSESPLPPLEGGWLALSLFVVALLPAIFEETLFRGILARNMHGAGWGTWVTVLVSGAMFSLFHGRPEQTIYQFFCGCCFALIAVRSGSVLPTVLSHFLNNALILVLSALGLETFSGVLSVVLIVVGAVFLAGSLVFLIFFDKKTDRKGGAPRAGVFFLAAAVGLVICAVQWASMLLLGFANV